MEQKASVTVTYYIQIGIIVKAVLCVVKHFDTGSPGKVACAGTIGDRLDDPSVLAPLPLILLLRSSAEV
jgi:hypothetical protein